MQLCLQKRAYLTLIWSALVSPNEILEKLSMRDLGYQVTSKEIDTLVNKVPFTLVADINSMNLLIMLKVPVAAQKTFDIYECFLLPKIEDSLVVSLIEVPKYFAISEDKLQYVQKDSIDCLVTGEHKYICKDLIVRNLENYPTCVTNVFVQRTDNLCRYKRYLSEFDAHNKIKGGLIVFSSKGLIMNLTCGTFKSTKNINGSVLINAPDHCELKSEKFTFNTNQLTRNIDLGNEAPEITCC